MESSPPPPSQILPTNLHNSIFPGGKCPSSDHRTPSSSSFSSHFLDQSATPLAPATPLRLISGVPFSWEKLPGVPKKFHDDSSLNLLLPLPPSKPASNPSREFVNKKMIKSPEEDPFFAALVECSKQDHQSDHLSINSNIWCNKVSRTLSDRFGFVNLYTSCKKTSPVSESIIYLPRSARTASGYSRR